MSWVHLQIKDSTFFSPSPPHLSSSKSSGFNLNNKVTPSILVIITILAIIFFISGLLHLLVRFLLRPRNRDPNEMDNVTALEGQLQQLFNLHDSGVDQSFIDTLPVFDYKAIIGLKNPFDCAVCLCEFEPEDKLRLLPKCSHAFHMDCIDTWLLSHSTCPICRASLLCDFPQNGNFSPIVLVLESRSESSREICEEGEIARVNSHLSARFDDDFGQKSCEIQVKEDEIESEKEIVGSRGKVVEIKLGKFRSVDSGFEGGNSNANARRCFSMGSFAYVMDENLSLQVPIRTPIKKQSSKRPSLIPGHRSAMSECGSDSRREFNGFEAFKVLEIQSGGIDNKSIERNKKESFSVSKIWLRGKRDKANEVKMGSSRRAFSFRFPIHRNPVATEASGESKLNHGGSENGFDEGILSFNSLDSQANLPSFARTTLGWLMGMQNMVVHDSSFSSNV